jgi:hypothetical protein
MAKSHDFPLRPAVIQGVESGPYLVRDEHGVPDFLNWDGANFWSEKSGLIVTPTIWFGIPNF